MITKFLTFLTSLVLGGTTLFGLVTQQTEQDTNISPASTYPAAATVPQVTPIPAQTNAIRLQNEPFRGDRRLLRDLGLATGQTTGLQPGEVRKALQDGKSLLQIIESQGKSITDVLTIVSENIKVILDRAVENGKMTQSWADKTMTFLADAARKMINQPGLKPAYPGLSELRRSLLVSASKVGNLNRDQIKDGLSTCKSLDQILRENNSSSEKVIQTVMDRVNTWLDQLVSNKKFNETQHQEWSSSIQTTLKDIITLPGFGKKQDCSQ